MLVMKYIRCVDEKRGTSEYHSLQCCHYTAILFPLENSYNLNLWRSSKGMIQWWTLKSLSDLPTALISLVSGDKEIIIIYEEFAYSYVNLWEVWKISSYYSPLGFFLLTHFLSLCIILSYNYWRPSLCPGFCYVLDRWGWMRHGFV